MTPRPPGLFAARTWICAVVLVAAVACTGESAPGDALERAFEARSSEEIASRFAGSTNTTIAAASYTGLTTIRIAGIRAGGSSTTAVATGN